jgi:hypothetical protein
MKLICGGDAEGCAGLLKRIAGEGTAKAEIAPGVIRYLRSHADRIGVPGPLARHDGEREPACLQVEDGGRPLRMVHAGSVGHGAHTLEAGIRAPHTASLMRRAQGAEEAREAEAEGGIHPSLWPCGLVCGSIRRQGLRISCPGLRRDARRRGPVQVGRLARDPGGLPAHKRLTPSVLSPTRGASACVSYNVPRLPGAISVLLRHPCCHPNASRFQPCAVGFLFCLRSPISIMCSVYILLQCGIIWIALCLKLRTWPASEPKSGAFFMGGFYQPVLLFR